MLNHRRSLRAFSGSAAALLAAASTGCASGGPELARTSALSFVCDEGKSFRVSYFAGQVRVMTGAGAYDLKLRRSSIGTRYSSGETTFILDEERAVLTGADGSPFKRCHEA